jgi:hypothetical protein
MEIRFEPKSLHSALKALFFLSALFGIAPLKLKSSGMAPGYCKASIGLRWEIGRTLYPFTILLALIVSNCISLHLKIQAVYKQLKYTYVLTDSFKSVLAFATVVVSIIQTITFNRNKLDIIISKINSSEKSVLRNSSSRMCRRTSRMFVTYLTLVAVTFGLACTCEIISSGRSPIIVTTGFCSHIIRIAMDMQFVTFNFRLKYLFDVLNKQLLSIFGIRSERDLEQNLLDNICSQPKLFSEYNDTPLRTRESNIYGENRRMWKRSPVIDTECIPNTNFRKETGLHVLRIHHNEICNITRLVVSTYGVFIVFELLNISADIIAVLYFTADRVISEVYMDMEAIATCSLWLLLNALKLIGITRSCQLVSNCGNHASVLLAKLMLLSRHFSSSGMVQLKLFSQQLLNTKLRLSACDFFDLNNAMLKSVVKTAITYVIVLLLNQTI